MGPPSKTGVVIQQYIPQNSVVLKKKQKCIRASLFPFHSAYFAQCCFLITFSSIWNVFLELVQLCSPCPASEHTALFAGHVGGCGSMVAQGSGLAGQCSQPFSFRWCWHLIESSAFFLDSLNILFPLQIFVFLTEERESLPFKWSWSVYYSVAKSLLWKWVLLSSQLSPLFLIWNLPVSTAR